MNIGILSDTHGNILRTHTAIRMFAQLEVGQIIHCGDIGTAEIIAALSRWPTHYVFGNVDSPILLRDAIAEAGGICHERFGMLEVEGKRVAFLHGDDGRLLESTIISDRWDLVCHGHTHYARQVRMGRTLVLNPGAVHRSPTPSVAMIELPSLEITELPI